MIEGGAFLGRTLSGRLDGPSIGSHREVLFHGDNRAHETCAGKGDAVPEIR